LKFGRNSPFDENGDAVSSVVQQAKTPTFSLIVKARVQFQPDPRRASKEK